jgi:phosphatidylserine decarboxylase
MTPTTHHNYLFSHAPEFVIVVAVLLLSGVVVLLLVTKKKSGSAKVVVVAGWSLVATSLIFLAALLTFFRGWSPPPSLAALSRAERRRRLFCPCDGVIRDVIIDDDAAGTIRIVVFLNVHNVHVQYAPCDGVVTALRYRPGSFHPAYLLEKSVYNERMEYDLWSDDAFGGVTVVQIAGQLARRIVPLVSQGDAVRAFEQPMGLIKLGSRCDIIVSSSLRHALVTDVVQKGRRVHIGDTLLLLPTPTGGRGVI